MIQDRDLYVGHSTTKLGSSLLTLLVGCFCSFSAVSAQDDPDFDPSTRAVRYIGPNSGGDYVVRSTEIWAPDHYELGANLVVEAGGDLRISGSHFVVRGDVTLKHNGKLHVSDSTVMLKNGHPRQFNYYWLGGHLYTERVTIGGTKVNGAALISNLWLNNGTWDAFHTTVQYTGGILLGFGRSGYLGNPDQKGGTLRATGLHRGEACDALLLSGCGDAFLRDSTYSIGLYVYCDGPAFSAPLDLGVRDMIGHDVYGDPSVHQGVTRGLPGSPWRLQLDNVKVPFWNLFAMEATDRGAPVKLTLLNAEALNLSFHGGDMVGSPVLGGNWGQYYSRLPGLPSTRTPGHHPIPPSCSVKLGNVTFETGPSQNDWAHVHSWGLYLRGSSTNVTVNGACAIAEVWLGDATLSIFGDEHFNAGIYANTINLTGSSRMNIERAAIGEFGVNRGLLAEIATSASAICMIRTARISDLRLVASDSSLINVTNPFVEGRLIEDRYGGSITFGKAPAWEAWDLQNLDFEAGVHSGTASFWQSVASSGVESSDRRPSTPGSKSFEYWSPAPGVLFKDVHVSEETRVGFLGWAKVLGLGSGSYMHMNISNGSNNKYADVLNTPEWQCVHVPEYALSGGQTSARVSFSNGGTSAHARLDDFRVLIGNWWENNNLCNMDFEDLAYRHVGTFPGLAKAPDYWRVWQCSAAPEWEPANRRPGSAAGSYSTRLTASSTVGTMTKDLTFLKPGDRVRLHGWLRGQPPGGALAYMQIQIGEGNDYWRPNGVNKSADFLCDGRWREFTLDYTVPWPPAKQAFTKICLTSWGLQGNVVYADDFSVSIR